MSTPREDYQREFFSLIYKLAEDFTQDQCKKLSYIYQKLFTASFYDQYAKDPFKLLDYLLKERKIYSLEKPENLAKMMEDLGFPDKKELVESFIDEHKEIFSTHSVRGRALPPTPEPIQEETEGPYVTLHQVPDMSHSNSISTLSGAGPSVYLEDQMLEGGLYVQPVLSHQLSEKNLISPRMAPDSKNCTDDEEIIYEEIRPAVLKHLSHEIPPLLIERMECAVSLLKDMVDRNNGGVIKSGPFICPVLNFDFLLEVNPSDCQSVSAKLFLFTNAQVKTGHLNENYYTVELTVNQSKEIKPQRGGPDTSNLLYSTCKVMEKPTLQQSNIASYNTHSEVPTITEPRIDHEVFPRQREDKDICIASFPSIISHRNLIDRNLVSKPYFIFTFTLRHKQL